MRHERRREQKKRKRDVIFFCFSFALPHTSLVVSLPVRVSLADYITCKAKEGYFAWMPTGRMSFTSCTSPSILSVCLRMRKKLGNYEKKTSTSKETPSMYSLLWFLSFSILNSQFSILHSLFSIRHSTFFFILFPFSILWLEWLYMSTEVFVSSFFSPIMSPKLHDIYWVIKVPSLGS